MSSMPSSQGPVRRLLIVAATAVTLAGCSSAPPTQVPTTAPAPVVAATQRPARTDLDCIDRTGSLPPWFTQRALGHVADQIRDAVTGPMQAARFYVRSTSSDSYSPAAEIATVRLDAVPSPPTPPTASANPYLRKQDNQQTTAYQADLESWNASLTKARSVATTESTRVRGISLLVDTTGTDVLGCPLRATDLLGTVGDRNLFIASDLVAEGPQQDIALPLGALTGVHVSVAFYCTDLAGICSTRITAFSDALRQSGATDVTVIDPQNLDQ